MRRVGSIVNLLVFYIMFRLINEHTGPVFHIIPFPVNEWPITDRNKTLFVKLHALVLDELVVIMINLKRRVAISEWLSYDAASVQPRSAGVSRPFLPYLWHVILASVEAKVVSEILFFHGSTICGKKTTQYFFTEKICQIKTKLFQKCTTVK